MAEPFHVVTFDKSLHEYYAKFFAVQRTTPDIEGTEEPPL